MSFSILALECVLLSECIDDALSNWFVTLMSDPAHFHVLLMAVGDMLDD